MTDSIILTEFNSANDTTKLKILNAKLDLVLTLVTKPIKYKPGRKRVTMIGAPIYADSVKKISEKLKEELGTSGSFKNIQFEAIDFYKGIMAYNKPYTEEVAKTLEQTGARLVACMNAVFPRSAGSWKFVKYVTPGEAPKPAAWNK